MSTDAAGSGFSIASTTVSLYSSATGLGAAVQSINTNDLPSLQTIVANAPAGGTPTITPGFMPIAEDTATPAPMRMVRHRRSSEQERH